MLSEELMNDPTALVEIIKRIKELRADAAKLQDELGMKVSECEAEQCKLDLLLGQGKKENKKQEGKKNKPSVSAARKLELILTCFPGDGHITTSHIQTTTGLNYQQVVTTVAEQVEKGVLVKHGTAKGTYYSLADKPAPTLTTAPTKHKNKKEEATATVAQ